MSRALILIVEDNLINQQLARDVVEAMGHSVVTAGDAETGLSLAREQRPDLVLMDVGLPGLDGLQATRRLRADPQIGGTPVLVLTAHAMRGDREAALAAGGDGYLSKPFRVADLRSAVEDLLAAPPSRPAGLTRTGGG